MEEAAVSGTGVSAADAGEWHPVIPSLEEAVGLEARYAAITGNLSGEERELEENCRKTLSVYEKNEKELKRLAEKYRLSAAEYQDIWYSAEEKDRVDDMLETKQTEKKDQREEMERGRQACGTGGTEQRTLSKRYG